MPSAESGHYTITDDDLKVTASGLKPLTQKRGLRVAANTVMSGDARLQVGELAEQVTVEVSTVRLGGPIVRERVFFFGSSDGTFERHNRGGLQSLPTAAFRAGLQRHSRPISGPQEDDIFLRICAENQGETEVEILP